MYMPSPIGLQKEVLALPSKGHFIVLGTAGSGKTTMAIYRARVLSQLNDGRVLFVTFNRTLVTYLKTIGAGYLNNVDVINYHKFAMGYLNFKNKLGNYVIVPTDKYNSTNKSKLIELAINQVLWNNKNAKLDKNLDFYVEEISIIQKMGITNLEQYCNKQSNKEFNLGEKEIIFLVYCTYLEIRANKNYLYDYEDIASTVLEELIMDQTSKKYNHIVIDEGQDLSPVMIQSLINAVSSEGSVSYFGDVAQQIYGSDFSWRDAGFRNEVKWIFEQNYRNTVEIAELALKIAESDYYTDVLDMVAPKFSKANGPRPTLIHCVEDSELDFIIQNIVEFGKSESVGILVRTREQVKLISDTLRRNKIIFTELKKDMNAWIVKPTIYIGTIHSAKGLEFDVVCLAFADQENYPNEQKVNLTENYELACVEDIKLLYVGVTRAKRGLFITYSNNLTELLPSIEEFNYQFSYY